MLFKLKHKKRAMKKKTTTGIFNPIFVKLTHRCLIQVVAILSELQDVHQTFLI